LRHIDLQGRIAADQFLAQQVTVETTRTRQQPRRGARLVALLDPPGQVIEQHLAASRLQRDAALLQPTVEQGKVTAIGVATVLREAFFQP